MVNVVTYLFEDEHYVMNPTIETMVATCDLRNDMVVMVVEDEERTNVDFINRSIGQLFRAMKHNRWCTVKDLDVHAGSFTGVYPDGMRIRHRRNNDEFWYVKLDSVPKESLQVSGGEGGVGAGEDDELSDAERQILNQDMDWPTNT